MRPHRFPRRSIALSTALCGLLVAAGCTLRSPETEPRPKVSYDGGSSSIYNTDDRGGGDAGAEEPRLRLDPVTGSTHWRRVVIAGQGPSGGTVVVEEHFDDTSTADISSSGTFCVEASLVPDTENQLSVQALDGEGRYSEPIELTVVQQGEPPDTTSEPTEEDEPENVALGAEIDDTSMNIGSNPDALSDGDPGTFATLSRDNLSLASETWVTVALPERAAIDRIVYRSPSECVSTEYKVMLSDADDPAKALEGEGDWSVIEHVTPETAAPEREIEMDGPAVAGFIGLHLIDSSYGCDTETYQISELEAWSPPTSPGTQPAPQPPSCKTAAGTATD